MLEFNFKKSRLWKDSREFNWWAICSIVGLFTVLNRFFLQPWTLSPEQYRQPIIVLAALQDLLKMDSRSVVVLGTCLLLIWQCRSWCLRWTSLDDGHRIRWLVSASAFPLMWTYSTYEFNHFLQLSHLWDRALLFVLWLGIIWRPFFVFPFLLVLWALIGQFNVPIEGFSWAIPFLPARLLLLFAATLICAMPRKSWQSCNFFFVLFCVIAGHYFICGVGKLQLNWLSNDRVYLLLPSAYANGWLGFLTTDQIDQLTNGLAVVNWPLKLITVLAECGAIAVLWRRATLKLFPFLWIGFHLGVVATSGIFFWPWIIVLSVLLFLATQKPVLRERQFGPVHFLVSVTLIGLSSYWVRPAKLSWIDSPVTYTYRIVAVGQSGKEYSMSARYMAPFDYQFKLGAFHYLAKQKTVNSAFGATDPLTAKRFSEAGNTGDALAIEQELGMQGYNPKRAQAMRRFLVAYVESLNAGAPKNVVPSWLSAPKYLGGFSRSDAYDRSEPITTVRIVQVFSGFLNGHYKTFRSTEVLSVEIQLEGELKREILTEP